MSYCIVTYYERPGHATVVNVYGGPDWDKKKATSERGKMLRRNARELLTHDRPADGALTVYPRQLHVEGEFL